jgi:hypothetical protein
MRNGTAANKALKWIAALSGYSHLASALCMEYDEEWHGE